MADPQHEIRGGRVQCIYNPTVGREQAWGAGTLDRAASAKRVLVVGAGPAGLEYARVAAARGHDVVGREQEDEIGGHVRALAALPGRAPFAGVAEWLAQQAAGNGAESRTATPVGDTTLFDELEHVVVATGARYRNDGFEGQTAAPLLGGARRTPSTTGSASKERASR